jgi:rubrerythrin
MIWPQKSAKSTNIKIILTYRNDSYLRILRNNNTKQKKRKPMSKTTENLKAAFAGESQARNKYTFFAEVARAEGYHYIAKIF